MGEMETLAQQDKTVVTTFQDPFFVAPNAQTRWLVRHGGSLVFVVLTTLSVLINGIRTVHMPDDLVNVRSVNDFDDDMMMIADLSYTKPSVVEAQPHPRGIAPSSSPSISFTLYRGLKLNYSYIQYYRCDPPTGKRRPLPLPMQQTGLFDFFIRITTNLKILIVGDSIAMQLSQTFDEAVGTAPENRHVLSYYAQTAEALHIGAPIRGGGVLAGYRLYHFFKDDNELTRRHRRRLSKTWNRTEINTKILQHIYQRPLNNSHETTSIQQLDVVVQRIAHGWHTLEEITLDALHRNAQNVYELFGAKTLIILSLPFVNNVDDDETWRHLLEKRKLLRNFSRDWEPPVDGGIQHVMVLELGSFLDQMYEWNARCIGFNTSLGVEDWMLKHRLAKWRPKLPFDSKIAHLCAEHRPDNAAGCLQNSITVDGMHLCMSTVGGRLIGGLACMMACAHNQRLERAALKSCEMQCNDRFMSLTPIPESEMVDWNQSMPR